MVMKAVRSAIGKERGGRGKGGQGGHAVIRLSTLYHPIIEHMMYVDKRVNERGRKPK
jgi:hypothetical protein